MASIQGCGSKRFIPCCRALHASAKAPALRCFSPSLTEPPRALPLSNLHTSTDAAIKPTMPVAGNHEACGGCPANPVDPDSKGNFSEYRARMHSVAMHSNSGNNIFYSFERGLVHFLVFSAEAYLYARNAAFLANQLAFMKADLAGVDRARTPWVVALVHKDFTMEGEAFAAFTPILNAGGVDLLFCGHVCIPWRRLENEE